MAYVLTIAGTVRTLQPGFAITESANSRNRFQGKVLSDGTWRIAIDDVVTLTESGTLIFAGLIDQPAEAGFGGSGATSEIVLTVSASDYNLYASRITITAAIPAGTLKAALIVIAAALTAQGVTLDGAQATGPSLPALSFTDGPIIDALNQIVSLANGSGATSWVWEIDYTKTLRAVESGTVAAPSNLADGDGNIGLGDITVEQARTSDFANYIILLGGSGTLAVADSFTGDGVTTTFALTRPVSATFGYVTSAGIYETLGTFPATWSYDPVANSITRVLGPPALGDSIVITYIAQFPVRIVADSGGPAADRVTKTYSAPDVFDTATMQSLADSYLARAMDAPKTAKFTLQYGLTGWHPGQTLTITSTKRDLSGTFLVTEVRIENPVGNLVRRQITAVSSTRLPQTTRESFQQVFGNATGGSGSGVSAAGSVTAGAVAAGSNTDVQFNDGGNFGGDANFRYDKVTHCLVMGALSDISAVSPESCVVFGYDCHIEDA